MEKKSSAIRKFFSDKPGIASVQVFGSTAKGTVHRGSDIDIAVLCDRDSIPDPLQIMDWKEDLIGILEQKVDLVCLNTASPILGMQVLQHSKEILLNDSKAYHQYFANLITAYADLKIMRKPLEDSILERRQYGS